MLNKKNISDTIINCNEFYNKQIYHKIHNKRLNGINYKLYSIAQTILLNKINKCIKLSKASEPDFTLMKELGETMKLHQSTNKFDNWSEYDINTVKMYLPKCVVSGDFYRFIGLKSIEINQIIESNNYDIDNLSDIENAIKQVIIPTGVACCTKDKSYVDNSTLDSGKLYIDRNNKNNEVVIDVPCRLIITINDGIDVAMFWEELKNNAYDIDYDEFVKDFGECMGQLVSDEQEVIGQMTSNYKIYNLKEIQNYL